MCEYARGKRITIGKVGVSTPMQARDKAKDILADAVKGIDPKQSKMPIQSTTFKIFIENEYTSWATSHYKDGATTIARIKSCFFGLFGDKKIEEISAFHVEKWRTERKAKGIKPSTINRDLIALKACISTATKWGIIKTNPLKDLKLSRLDPNINVRYLTHEEEERLRATLDAREKNLRDKRKNANSWRTLG